LQRRTAQQGEAIGLVTQTEQPLYGWLVSTICMGTDTCPRDATLLQIG